MKNNSKPQLHISLSKEHKKYQLDVAGIFKDFDTTFDNGLMRFSAAEMPMQIIISLGVGIATNLIWDMLKLGIKNTYKKFKNSRIVIRDNESIMYTVKPDLSIYVVVVPDRAKKFEHIKTIDDLAVHLQRLVKINPHLGWHLVSVGDIFTFVRTYAFSRENLNTGKYAAGKIGNIHYGDIHSTYTSPSIDLNNVDIPIVKDANFTPKNEDLLKDGDLIMADASEDYEGIGVTVSVHGLQGKKVVGGLHTFILRDETNKTTEYYRQFIFKNPDLRNRLQKVANGVSVYGVSKSAVSKIILPLPSLAEQKRISDILEAWGEAIEKQTRKIGIKRSIKKALMLDLLTGKKRLSGFKGKWQTVEIGELLNYEQPGKYIVESTDYSDAYKIPVLTANKGFILGFTDETNGIYKNVPVVIFDDFTMDNKFVDFEFKVKSSAIKILTPKNKEVNLKFVFEKMQLIKVVIGQHRRHYLSEYQYTTMDVPDTKEQNAIANILITADKEITELEKKLSIIKNQKKYLLNNLITGTVRTPENMKI